MGEQENRGANQFKTILDDLTLGKVAALYPEPMREPLMWLGWFAREECSKDLDVLVAKFRELGIDHDKTTWSKILRGRWQLDAAGNALPSPIISEEKFLRAVKTLRTDQRVKDLAGRVPFIMTPTAQDIFNYIDIRRAPERINRFGVVVGYTGTQKTASGQEYARRNNHGLTTWMESPERGSIRELICSLGVKYGGGRHDSFERHKRRVLETVGSRHSIIFDNVQAMYREEAGNNQPVFNFFRRLQDESKCTIIFASSRT